VNLEQLEKNNQMLSNCLEDLREAQDKQKKLVAEMAEVDMDLKRAYHRLAEVQKNMGIKSDFKASSKRVARKDSMKLIVDMMRQHKDRLFRTLEIMEFTGLSRGAVNGALRDLLESNPSPVKKTGADRGKIHTRYSWDQGYSAQ
jgi:hypothetical protein